MDSWLQRDRSASQAVLYLVRNMVPLLAETKTLTLYFSCCGTQGVSDLLGFQTFNPTGCIWYFLRSTYIGTVTAEHSQNSHYGLHERHLQH